MKPTAKYIKRAMDVLQAKDDERSRIQLRVLISNRSERWVFKTYVLERQGTEEEYYIAREAAQFLSGAISFDDFLPDAQSVIATAARPTPSMKITSADRDNITINSKVLNNILTRLNRLERLYGIRKTEINFKKVEANESTPTDLISQAEAIRLLNVGKTTIKRWAARGYIRGYLTGSRVSYSRSELFDSDVVSAHLIANPINAQP